MTDRDPPLSPRVAALRQTLASGNTGALTSFWQDMAAQGTPLIEPIEGDDTDVLVTFLWRGGDELNNVVVISDIGGWDLVSNQMLHLPASDLWYKTYRVRADARSTYQFSLNDPLTPWHMIEHWEAYMERWQLDPLNPAALIFPKDAEYPDSKELKESIVTLPAAPAQPWILPRPDIASGRVECHRRRSAILDNERRIWVYTPPDYTADGQPYGLVLLFDGWSYQNVIPTPIILDNLRAARRIPPQVAVLIGNAPDARSRELPCYPPFVDFLTQELLPWVRQHYNVTSDPTRTVVGGSSYGGLAATFAGLHCPEAFGNILVQSGSFWWKPEGDTEYEWLAREFVASPLLPLRFYLEVGLLERASSDGAPNQLVVNRHMRNILQAKGYPVHYAEYSGGHGYVNWRGTLADGLIALIGSQP